jgi:hypothetical protein
VRHSEPSTPADKHVDGKVCTNVKGDGHMSMAIRIEMNLDTFF